MKIKNKISILIIIFMLLELFIPIFNYSKSMAVENENTQGVDNSYDASNTTRGGEEALPSKYDLREHIPIKVDNQLGDTCWNYAATKCLETNVAMTTGEYYDFSEMYLEYMSSEKMYDKDIDRRFDRGGLFSYAMSYYKPYGAALAEDIPNRYYEEDEYDTIRNAKCVKEVVESIDYGRSIDWSNYTSEELDEYRKTIKNHIMKYGGVYAQIYTENDEYGGMNNETNSYYRTIGGSTHAVVVIGWDDTYSKDNFLEDNQPSSDGAFIVLNSYGKKSGENGCFYASYEDLGLLSTMKGIISTRDVDEENISYHSGFLRRGYIYNFGIGHMPLEVGRRLYSYPYYANVFDTNDEEYLTKLSFLICDVGDIGKEITYEVYVNPVDGELNSDNYIKVVPEKTIIAQENFATEYLKNPVKLTGEKYVVVVKCYNNMFYETFEDGVNTYTYTSTDLNSNWEKSEAIYTNVDDGSKTSCNMPIMTYTRGKKTIELGNMNELNYFAKNTEKTLSFYFNTEGIDDGTDLNVTIRNKDGYCTDDFTISGNTIQNGEGDISIHIPDTIEPGTYIIDVSYDGVTKTKAFTIYETKVITDLRITTPPNKTFYYAGDNFDPEGMVVTAYYDDGSSKNVTDYELMYENDLKAGQLDVIVKYEENDVEKNISQDITVAPGRLTRIEITKAPSKTEYAEGSRFSKNKMEVTAYYSDGSSEVIKKNDIEVIDGDRLQLNQSEVTISYTLGEITKTATQSITVNPLSNYELTMITIYKQPNKTEYYEGENFDPSGMVVRANFSGAGFIDITDYTIIDGENLQNGQETVTISYTHGNVTRTNEVEITVKKKNISKIEITTPPNKKRYIVGENFDPTGMVVTAYYDNGSSGIITDYMMTNSKNLKDGQQFVVVFYVVDNKTYTALQPILVRQEYGELLIIEPPTKTTYMQGESFDEYGLIVEIKDKNGKNIIITDDVMSNLSYMTTFNADIIMNGEVDILNGTKLKYGQKYVEAILEYKGVTYVGKIDITVLNGSEQYRKSLRCVRINESNLSYRSRRLITPGDIRVIATYDDGSTEEITEYTIVDQYIDENGDRKVTISYQVGDETITETITTGKDTSDDETENESGNGIEQEKEIINSDETTANSVIPKTGVYSISGILALITAAVAIVINKRK
ncbi:MAG: bacterial Ig-like domain-containing protein [Clostridia bacterium]|nr:bacterial Ig-like domain-containing protein [Clostridia bacterium]